MHISAAQDRPACRVVLDFLALVAASSAAAAGKKSQFIVWKEEEIAKSSIS